MKNPLVSIIIPAYNASKHIVETLDSIKKQSYTNWEIILVNDCSTDNTIQLVNQNAKQVSNPIKIITNKTNKGVSVSRNLAVANASGSWLALLDSDDVWLPNHLETLINEVNKDCQLDLVYSGYLVFLDNVKNIVNKQEINEDILNNFNMSLYTSQIAINPCTVLINKNSWNSIGGMIPNLHHAEDKEFFIALAKTGAKFKFSGYHTSLYRKYSNASSASYNEVKMALGSLYIYEKYIDWEVIPIKIRIDQLSSAHLSYSRLVRQVDIKTAVQHSLKALRIKKNIKNGSYFLAFIFLSLFKK